MFARVSLQIAKRSAAVLRGFRRWEALHGIPGYVPSLHLSGVCASGLVLCKKNLPGTQALQRHLRESEYRKQATLSVAGWR